MENLPSPRVRHTQANSQFTYSLNRRVYDVKTYPVQSPQGSHVLLYGHENGVTVVWRGGRRLRVSPPAPRTKSNGASTGDAIMILSSDDDEPHDQPEFEELSTDSAYPEIIQTLDLSMGTSVRHIAVLPMAPCSSADAAWHGADILTRRIVFAVSCATNDVFLITLPLTPPSHERKSRAQLQKGLLNGNLGKGAWDETVTLLAGQGRPSDAIALNIVKPQSVSDRSRSYERAAMSRNDASRVIVAASAREASGTLRFWDVTLAKPSAATPSVDPFQTEYLASPLTAIHFNPAHTTQLLAIASPHAVRIYDYSIASLPSDDTSEGPFPAQGSWLLSLYGPFLPASTAMSTNRKPIVAAQWIALGRAVLVLFADGQWGIWDIDGVSPSPGSKPVFGANLGQLRGSALSTFSVSGYLEGTSPLRNPGSQKAAPSGGNASFVPMTPHTRALAAVMSGGSERLAAVRGGIEVVQLPESRGATTAQESAILWMSGIDPVVIAIPVISRFWDAQLRKGASGGAGLFGGAQVTRMVRLPDLGSGLLGERCTGVSVIPTSKQQASWERQDSGELPVELVLQGESRLMVVHDHGNTTAFTKQLISHRGKTPRPRDRQPSAIIAYPRPEKPSSVAFNLSVSRRGPARSRAGLTGLFDAPALAPAEESRAGSVPTSMGAGLAFATDLEKAADQPDDESEADNRDVEQEMMDIMEIDRELEQMAQNREQGTKRVFFEA